jgi:hypothetical protein
MAKKFNRDTEGAPLSRGLSASEIIARAAKKNSYEEVTEDDIRSLAQSQGFGQKNIEKMVKGFRNLGKEPSLEINEAGTQFNVFNKEGSGADRTSKSTGNRKGFDPGDLIGLGKNINKFAALAANAQKVAAAEKDKSEDSPKVNIEGTPVATGTVIDNWWKNQNTSGSSSGGGKKGGSKGDGKATTTEETVKGGPVPGILHPNEDNSKLRPAIGNLDGGFLLNPKGKSSTASSVAEQDKDMLSFLTEAYDKNHVSLLDKGVNALFTNPGDSPFSPKRGITSRVFGREDRYQKLIDLYKKDLAGEASDKWTGKRKVEVGPTEEYYKDLESRVPLITGPDSGIDLVGGVGLQKLAQAGVRQLVKKGWVPNAAKELNLVKELLKKGKTTKGATALKVEKISPIKAGTTDAVKKTNPGTFSPNVEPNFQSGATTVPTMKSTTFDKMTEYTDETVDAFKNWFKQMKQGGKIEKRRIGGSARLFAQEGLKVPYTSGKYTPSSLVKFNFNQDIPKLPFPATSNVSTSLKPTSYRGIKFDPQAGSPSQEAIVKSPDNFNSDIDNRKGSGKFPITKDNALDALETTWSIGYPELMKRKLRMENEKPRDRKYIEFGAMPEQDLPFKPEVKSATPNQRNMVVDAQAMLGFAKAVNSENELARREWGYKNAGQKLATRANIIETENKERMYNDQQQTADANQLAYRNLQRQMYNQQTMKEIGQGTYANVLKGIREPRFNSAADMYENAREIIRNPGSNDQLRAEAEAVLASSFQKKKQSGGKIKASSLLKSKA